MNSTLRSLSYSKRTKVKEINIEYAKIAVIGLGYVGLPLAVEFGKHREVLGFDINAKRVDELKSGHDFTLETTPEELSKATGLSFTCDVDQLNQANVFIVTVPTPIDEFDAPDMTALRKASEMLSRVIKKGDIVIYESF